MQPGAAPTPTNIPLTPVRPGVAGTSHAKGAQAEPRTRNLGPKIQAKTEKGPSSDSVSDLSMDDDDIARNLSNRFAVFQEEDEKEPPGQRSRSLKIKPTRRARKKRNNNTGPAQALETISEESETRVQCHIVRGLRQ